MFEAFGVVAFKGKKGKEIFFRWSQGRLELVRSKCCGMHHTTAKHMHNSLGSDQFLYKFDNYIWFLTIWHLWHNDFSSQMTSDCQRRIREWVRNTLRCFSMIFSPSILHATPLAWMTISISLSLSTHCFSHQNKNVRRLSTTVERSLRYSFYFKLQKPCILIEGRET